jgi:predicted regulator of Ras-like GTPase activity (Roadblock/LC7/MglB family)
MHDYFATSGAQTSRDRLPRAICENSLTHLCANHPEVSLALIATTDAHVVSHRSHAGLDAARIAAMTSSIIAICESLSNELDGGGCQSASISMGEYTFVIAHIPTPQQSLALAIGVTHDILLARARRLTLDFSARIARSLDALDLPPSQP